MAQLTVRSLDNQKGIDHFLQILAWSADFSAQEKYDLGEIFNFKYLNFIL